MNYYGTKEYKSYMEEFERRIFSKIKFDDYERIKELGEGYSVKYYYYADVENQKPGHAALDGQICRLYKNDELLFEWKNTDGKSRVADLIHHSDGNTYHVDNGCSHGSPEFVIAEDLNVVAKADYISPERIHSGPFTGTGDQGEYDRVRHKEHETDKGRCDKQPCPAFFSFCHGGSVYFDFCFCHFLFPLNLIKRAPRHNIQRGSVWF